MKCDMIKNASEGSDTDSFVVPTDEGIGEDFDVALTTIFRYGSLEYEWDVTFPWLIGSTATLEYEISYELTNAIEGYDLEDAALWFEGLAREGLDYSIVTSFESLAGDPLGQVFIEQKGLTRKQRLRLGFQSGTDRVRATTLIDFENRSGRSVTLNQIVQGYGVGPRAHEIEEPGVIALIGVGLAGFGVAWAGRRTRRSKALVGPPFSVALQARKRTSKRAWLRVSSMWAIAAARAAGNSAPSSTRLAQARLASAIFVKSGVGAREVNAMVLARAAWPSG